MDKDRWLPEHLTFLKWEAFDYKDFVDIFPDAALAMPKPEPEREEPSPDKIQGYLDGYQAAIDVAKSIRSSVVIDQDIIVYILENNLKNMIDAEASK